MKIHVVDVPRSSDNLMLSLLALRRDGVGTTKIAKRFGLRENYVRIATNRIMAAYLAESGESSGVIRWSYWQ